MFNARLRLALFSALLVASPLAAQSHSDFTETVGATSFTMKAIPGGTFMMGCGPHEEPCATTEWADKANDQRKREVTVAPFYLAETETTWALYQQCINAGGAKTIPSMAATTDGAKASGLSSK